MRTVAAWLPVVLCILQANVWAIQAAPAQKLPPLPFFSDNRTTITVCTSSYTPMVYCDSETDPNTWSGYEVELFRRIADKLQWPMEQMKWKCLDWSEVEENLVAGDGSCDVAPMGLPALPSYIDEGIVFSWPTLESGLVVSVTNQQKAVSIWAFMDAFTWQLWLVIIVTCLLVGLVIFGIDAWLIGAKVDRKKKKIIVGNNENCEQEIALADYIWDAMMRPMQVRDMRPLSTFASNFVVLAFAFMMLVVVTVYTANTTANITATRLQSTIRGVEDLPGKVVGTWEDYVPDLAKVGVTAIGFPWETDEDESAMLEALTNGTIQALVLDNSYLTYVASSSCEIAVVGTEFDEKNSAIALASNIDEPEVIIAMNNALAELREDGSQSLLVDTLIEPPEVACKTNLVSGTTTKIGVDELAGLWIMLAVGIVIAVVIVIVYKLHLKYTKKHIEKASKSLKKKMSTTMKMTKQFSSGRRTSFGRSSSLGSSDKGENTKSGESSDGHEMNTVQENEDVV